MKLNDELSNTDIDRIVKALDWSEFYLGTFSRDEINNIKMQTDKPQFLIINMQPSTKGNGTHWVCAIHFPGYNLIDYFDSFGAPEPTNVKSFAKNNNIDQIITNKIEYQPFGSDLCGYYCLYFINNRLNHLHPHEIFPHETMEKNNELVKRFKEHIQKLL